MLYLQLISYCYDQKEIAYPSLKTLSVNIGVSIKTILVYREVLVSYGLIKKIIRRKNKKGSYQSTLYQLVRLNQSMPEEDIDENEPVVSEVIDVLEKELIKTNENSNKKDSGIIQEMKELGISKNTAQFLLTQYPQEKIKRKLYLIRAKPDLHHPGAYLDSVLRNDAHNKAIDQTSMDELTPVESDTINRRECIARRRYYQKMGKDALPRQESLKWIRQVKQQMKEGKMMCDMKK